MLVKKLRGLSHLSQEVPPVELKLVSAIYCVYNDSSRPG